MIKLISGALMMMLCCSAVLSDAYAATREDVVSFVEKAAAFVKENGKEAALKAFMDRSGPFVQGELYIYAYDFNGTVISHGGQADLVGKNLIDMKDVNGVMVIQELIKLAQQGSGWLNYAWPDPLRENTVQPKAGYVMKIDETWWLGSGLYPKDQK